MGFWVLYRYIEREKKDLDRETVGGGGVGFRGLLPPRSPRGVPLQSWWYEGGGGGLKGKRAFPRSVSPRNIGQ